MVDMIARGREGILGNLRASDLFLFLYLCTQFCYPFGNSLDTNLCRATFLSYMLVAVAFDVVPLVKQQDKRLFDQFLVWAIAFWSFAFISLLWSPDLGTAFDVTYLNNALHIIVLALLLPARFRSFEDFCLLLKIFMLAVVYVAIMLVLKTPASAWGTERIGDAIGLNRNSASMLLVFASFIAFFLARKQRSSLYYLPCIPLIALSLMTGSRKGFLLIPICFLAFFISSERGWKGLVKFLVGLAVFGWLFNLVMTVPDLYNVIGVRLEITLDGITDKNADTLDVMRAYYREYAMQLFDQRPLVGYGMNGFEIMLHYAISSDYAYSHCNYTELLSCFGIVGFALYYAELLYMSVQSAKLFSTDRSTASFLLVFLLAIVVLDYGNVSFPGIDNALFLLMIFIGIKAYMHNVSSAELDESRHPRRLIDERFH